jgi:hypothetical protein
MNNKVFSIKQSLPSIESVKKDYKQLLNEQFKSSSLSFFMKPINSKKSLIKLIWLIALLLAVLTNIYNVRLIILGYLKFDTTTSIYEINEKQSEFPTISFCSYDDEANFKNIKIIYLWFNSNDLTNEWYNHFEIYNDSSYGKCFRFNSGKNVQNESIPIKYSKKSGINDGFWLGFYLKTTRDFSKMIIYIHNQTKISPTINNKGDRINSGSENYFVLKRMHDEKLDHPYNDCYKNVSDSLFNKTIIDYMKSINHEYTQKECIEACRNLKSMEETNCNCSIKSLDEQFGLKCLEKAINKKVFNCSKQFLANFNVDICTTYYCPLECDSFSLNIETKSQAILAFGNVTDNSFYSQLKTYQDVYKSYFGINVYYEEFKYTFIKQNPKMEIFDLLSNIGGTFSLFLGLSIFSFLELFEILANLVFNLLFN